MLKQERSIMGKRRYVSDNPEWERYKDTYTLEQTNRINGFTKLSVGYQEAYEARQRGYNEREDYLFRVRKTTVQDMERVMAADAIRMRKSVFSVLKFN